MSQQSLGYLMYALPFSSVLIRLPGQTLRHLLQPMHLDLSITMLILFTSRYKVTNNNFYLAVFKTGINILVKVPVVLFGIVKVFGKAVPACFLSRSEVSNYAFADRKPFFKLADIH